MLRELETAIATCVTVTLVDGLVASRSAFDHSMNYRSVVAFRRARKIADPEQKINSLRVISELKATTVLEFPIEEASSKVRSGLPLGDERNYRLPLWAGILPLETKSRQPIPDDK